ncbi:unnamed protein product [Heligmosomoides polygyrus]|uniref:Uncharacterized protein n=1 Tax=Heligmosomoides polygyrus TaxID=6339 RepID=A0A183FG87_HELPZ|nr:unnamed protein product [Heligmosomoides polygyrus]
MTTPSARILFQHRDPGFRIYGPFILARCFHVRCAVLVAAIPFGSGGYYVRRRWIDVVVVRAMVSGVIMAAAAAASVKAPERLHSFKTAAAPIPGVCMPFASRLLLLLLRLKRSSLLPSRSNSNGSIDSLGHESPAARHAPVSIAGRKTPRNTTPPACVI